MLAVHYLPADTPAAIFGLMLVENTIPAMLGRWTLAVEVIASSVAELVAEQVIIVGSAWPTIAGLDELKMDPTLAGRALARPCSRLAAETCRGIVVAINPYHSSNSMVAKHLMSELLQPYLTVYSHPSSLSSWLVTSSSLCWLLCRSVHLYPKQRQSYHHI